jgi:hypothetical protein
VAVGEDLVANRKIEERRRFSELFVPAVSRFADSLRYYSGQSGSRDFFCVFFVARCPYLRTVRPPSPDCQRYCNSGFSVENRTASAKFVFRFLTCGLSAVLQWTVCVYCSGLSAARRLCCSDPFLARSVSNSSSVFCVGFLVI